MLSYGLYLFHGICLLFIDAQLPEPTTMLGDLAHDCIGLALSVAVAWVVHVLVEKPFANLRKRLTYQRVERAAGDSEAA